MEPAAGVCGVKFGTAKLTLSPGLSWAPLKRSQLSQRSRYGTAKKWLSSHMLSMSGDRCAEACEEVHGQVERVAG